MKLPTTPLKRFLAFLLILSTLSTVLASCAKSKSIDDNYDNGSTHSNGETDYTSDESINNNTNLDNNLISLFANGSYTAKIIRSDMPSDLEKEIYKKIRNILKEQTGKAPEFSTDFVASGEVKYDGPAILIGETNYPESQAAYGNLDPKHATATLIGNKYVISFSTKESAQKLVENLQKLISKSTKDNIVINSDWKITLKEGNIKMTKTEWLNQYKSKLSSRDIALLSRAYDILADNTIQGNDMPWGDAPAISPWSGSTAGLWNWDSVFHAMTVARYDSDLAKSCIDSFAMFQKESGLLPDVIYPNGKIEDNYSKPPVFAWGVLEVYKETVDLEFLNRNYERAVKYEGFWRTYRFDNGLFYYSAQENPERADYEHPRWESGWDNSPRWDIAPIVDIYPIDLNCFMVLYYRSMAEMAEILGKDASTWKAREIALTKEIEERLYNDAINAYVDRNRKTGEYSTVLTPASFMPLFIGIASKERASAMNNLARDESKFYPGMPSVSYDDQGYTNYYWRGPTWLNIAFFAIKGLDDYGFKDTADEMKEFLLNMCYNGLPYIYENYDTKTQQGKSHNLFSWSAAFIIEFVLEFNLKEN